LNLQKKKVNIWISIWIKLLHILNMRDIEIQSNDDAFIQNLRF